MNTLKKVQPNHQIGAHRHGDMYHGRADCPTGRLIHSEDLATGGRGLSYCDQCRELTEHTPEPEAP
ncbi:MAG: hypothetical protein ACXVJW_03260 [Acidimicrobiia bacterium]